MTIVFRLYRLIMLLVSFFERTNGILFVLDDRCFVLSHRISAQSMCRFHQICFSYQIEFFDLDPLWIQRCLCGETLILVLGAKRFFLSCSFSLCLRKCDSTCLTRSQTNGGNGQRKWPQTTSSPNPKSNLGQKNSHTSNTRNAQIAERFPAY